MKRLLIGSAIALLASPAFAGWDQSRVIPPQQAPIYGAPVTINGVTTTPIIGYLPGYDVVIPADQVTPQLQPYAEPVPAGESVLAGVSSAALHFSDLATAQSVLGPLGLWKPD